MYVARSDYDLISIFQCEDWALRWNIYNLLFWMLEKESVDGH